MSSGREWLATGKLGERPILSADIAWARREDEGEEGNSARKKRGPLATGADELTRGRLAKKEREHVQSPYHWKVQGEALQQ